MRIAIYDRFWSTMGGGERYAGGIAEVLAAAGHDVTLIAHEPLDIELVEERLALRLDGVGVELVPATPEAVTAASARADLFISASFTNTAKSSAPHSIYIVHFPTVPMLERSPVRRWIAQTGRRLLLRRPGRIEFASGLHTPEAMRRHTVRWTTGEAELLVHAEPGERLPVVLSLGRYLPVAVGPVTVEIEVDRQPAAEVVLRPVTNTRRDLRRVTKVRCTVTGRADGTPVPIVLRSRTYRPVDVVGGSDDRILGVPVAGVEVAGSPGERVVAALPGLLEAVPSLDFLDTYDRILGNSGYSAAWAERIWEREVGVLFPSVTMHAAGPKEKIILSVGRFFARGEGHSKKQLELVQAFRRLCERGTTGWTLHLVGGCAPENRPYLEEVRDAGAGLPVVVEVDATGERLAELYAAASVYWHAAGLGEDEEAHPDRMEHFGITTVEAMSAGAVPVVYAAGGQRDVVQHEVDGFHVGGLDELVERTEQLIADPALRDRLAAAARTHATRFSPEAFATSLLEEVERVVAEGERT